MSTARYQFTVTDERTLAPLAGMKIYVYDQVTGVAATMTDDLDQPLANPLVTDTFGQAYFNAVEALYRADFYLDGRLRYKESNIVVGDSNVVLKGAPPVAGRAGKFLAYDADGNPIASTGTGADDGLRTDLAEPDGSALAGFVNTGTGAVTRTLLLRGRSEAYVSDYGSITQAIASGAKTVKVDVDVGITSDVTLASDQVLEFTQGRIVPVSFATITDAILKSSGGENITVTNANIDAGLITAGAPGIKLSNVNNAKISGGKLTRCNLRLESSDNTITRGLMAEGLEIDMDGYGSTAVFCSGVRGAALRAMNIYGGLEGVGIYNASREVTHSQIFSHDFTGDAFVIINGQEIAYTDCYGYNTGQSGFTTQRQTDGANARIASYTNCYAWGHDYDGFDIRGAVTTPWDVDTAFQLTNCHAWDNTFVGFYIVNAEGTSLSNCTARQNGLQGFNIDNSDNVIMSNCRSISNAVDAPTGVGKAGIYVANSLHVQVNNCFSSNTEGGTQDYGITFAGTCTDSTISGGYYVGNTTGSHSLVTGVAMTGAVLDKEAAGAVTLLEITPNGAKRGECFGVPKTSFTLNWPIGSYIARLDGGGAESFLTAGSNSWWSIDRTVVP